MSRPGAATVFAVLALSVLLAFPAAAAGLSDGQALLEQGISAFQRGRLDTAVSRWMDAARAFGEAGQRGPQVTALTRLAEAQAALGQYRQAAATLHTALSIAEEAGDRGRLLVVLAGLGNVHIATGPPEAAERYLGQALTLARERADDRLRAVVLNTMGNLRAMQDRSVDALAAYRESAALASTTAQPVLAARALTNAARVAHRTPAAAETLALLDAARVHLAPLPPSHEVAVTLVNLGTAYRDLRPQDAAASAAALRRAAEVLLRAGTVADGLSDRRTASYAWGYLGSLYEDERRHAEALQLTRRAVQAAQQANSPESLYRWEWQTARIFKAQGDRDDALAAYRRAVATLDTIRPEAAVRYGDPRTSFRESMGAVYFELVDLLLRRTEQVADRAQATTLLVEARDVVESLKVAELRDYFRDDCVDLTLSKVASLDVVSPTTAVIYPIVLPDRLELLVTLPAGLQRVVVPVDQPTLTREVLQFRQHLEKKTTRRFLPHAQRLYSWIVRPLETSIAAAKIDTLVFVPDGPLRTIPMAALHDGKQFLVSRYALAITPGLTLTDPRPLAREAIRVLAVGVTEPVQGFPPLPEVKMELETLQRLFPGVVLVDEQFVIPNVERRLKEETFSVLHIASHGEFGGDAQSSFLLAFDEKLTMDRLDRLIGLFNRREEPLELLTLSACDTAAGDERAALGLAGVAVKAGARSAMATLWSINDQASAELVADFYRRLQDPRLSRAAALQQAQVQLLTDPRYGHPGFWAPFLLIANWL